MKNIRCIIIGDSHVDTIKKALKSYEMTEGIDFSAYRYPAIKNEKNIGDLTEEELDALCKGLTENEFLISVLGGNQHQVLSLIQHPQPFDVLEKNEIYEIEQDVQVIPYQQLLDLLQSGLNGKDGKRIKHLKSLTKAKMIHLVPPAPKENSEHILKKHETHFSNSGIHDKGVSKASLRAKIWRIQVNALKNLSAEWQVAILEPPKGTIEDNSFLKPEFYANDATHANEKYGELILAQLESLIQNEVKRHEEK